MAICSLPEFWQRDLQARAQPGQRDRGARQRRHLAARPTSHLRHDRRAREVAAHPSRTPAHPLSRQERPPRHRTGGNVGQHEREVRRHAQRGLLPDVPRLPRHKYGLGKPDLQTAIDTWHFGEDSKGQQGVNGWHQSAIFVADLGLTDEAKAMVISKFTDAFPERSPTFWGPNFDYTPDFNHAGSAMSALQEMLLQTNGRKIYVAPAWPKEWDVDFKLHGHP